VGTLLGEIELPRPKAAAPAAPVADFGTSPNGAGPVAGKYVYCIIACEEPVSFGAFGIGGRNDRIYTVHHGRLAAVVSDSPIGIYDPTRENVLAHEHVNQLVMNKFTVIPMAFSTIFRTDDDIVAFLRETHDAMVDILVKMKDKIEFGLKVLWDRDAVLKAIEASNDGLARLKEQIANNRQRSTYFERMQLGWMVERALKDQSESYISGIYNALRDHAVASRQDKPIGDKMILNAAFLVEREHEADFDAAVQELARSFGGKLAFRYTGPWPPYNFVNVRLRLERSGAQG
jgi:hypothetical protein